MSSKEGVGICTDVIPLELVGDEHINNKRFNYWKPNSKITLFS